MKVLIADKLAAVGLDWLKEQKDVELEVKPGLSPADTLTQMAWPGCRRGPASTCWQVKFRGLRRQQARSRSLLLWLAPRRADSLTRALTLSMARRSSPLSAASCAETIPQADRFFTPCPASPDGMAAGARALSPYGFA